MPRLDAFALEHPDRDRKAGAGAQKAIDDLRPVGTVIPAVAELYERAAPALEVGRAHALKHQHAVLKMPPGKAVLDPLLPLKEPVQRLVGLMILDPAKPQDLPPGTPPPSPCPPPARSRASSAA